MKSNELSHDVLREYCYELDYLYKIPDESITCWDFRREYILIEEYRSDYDTPLYLPFSYKEVPVKLGTSLFYKNKYLEELDKLFNPYNVSILEVVDDYASEVFLINQASIFKGPIYLPFKYKGLCILLEEEHELLTNVH